jgi:guanylate kinase
MPGILFIVSAPSGTGKTSLVKSVLDCEPEVSLSVSTTTRAPRAGEVEGRHYYFVSVPEFERMEQAGDFLESATIYGHRYGTSQEGIEQELERGRDVLLEIDWQGAQQVRKLMQGVIGIFIMPPSLDVLKARLMNRAQDSPDVIARRLAAAAEEMDHMVEYDYVIINEDFNRAALDLRSIIRAERLKLARHLARPGSLINRPK